jgi:acetyl-CoA acyltransferase 1
MSSRHLSSLFAPYIARAASTQARGLPSVLQKRADDIVITFAKRTAMGRAKKGQLRDTPVDELLYALFKVIRHTRTKTARNKFAGHIQGDQIGPL